jgi:hypothetical protein
MFVFGLGIALVTPNVVAIAGFLLLVLTIARRRLPRLSGLRWQFRSRSRSSQSLTVRRAFTQTPALHITRGRLIGTYER